MHGLVILSLIQSAIGLVVRQLCVAGNFKLDKNSTDQEDTSDQLCVAA